MSQITPIVASQQDQNQVDKCSQSSSPMSIVTIKVKGGQVFHLHKEILTKDSTYFDTALNGQFIEGQTQSIELDDVESRYFGLYVAVQHDISQPHSQLAIFSVLKSTEQRPFRFRDLLSLWQLADRFLNDRIKFIAHTSLYRRFAKSEARNWVSTYETQDRKKIRKSVMAIQSSYQFCIRENLPFQDKLVTAFANCPPQLFAEVVGSLDEDFRQAATKAFALRFASPSVTENRRKRDEEEAVQEEAKKRKK